MRPFAEDAAFQIARQCMVSEQLRQRGIRDERVLDAMARVPRHEFVASHYGSQAYLDHPVPLDLGQFISQPYMVATMLECLRLEPDSTVLEIGTGTGYQAALLAEIATRVLSIERIAALAEQARENLSRLGIENVEVEIGDGSMGFPARAPYDRIIVAAAAPVAPAALVEQLSEGGLLLVPVGPAESQVLQRIQRVGGQLRTELLDACRFVPLIGEQGNRQG